MHKNKDALHCLCCSKDIFDVLDLGEQPLANNLLDLPGDKFDQYALKLMGCSSCGHLQLSYFVDPEFLFKHYIYSSGTSNTLKNYFDWLAMSISKLLSNSSKHVLEIASNDGSFLDALKKYHINAIGLDPAENLNVIAREKGHAVIDGFWPDTNTDLLTKFDLIIAQNVFAHNPNPLEFLIAAKNSLKEEGIILIQTSQAEMLANGQFDTIYHEHYSFFSPSSLKEISSRAGLRLNNIFITTIHGGSYVSILSKNDGDYRQYFEGSWVAKNIDASLSFDKSQFDSLAKDFKINAKAVIQKTISTIDQYKSLGFLIVFVGAAAKAIVFLNFTEVKPDLVIDEAKLKIGKFIPKINREIFDFEAVRNIDQPILFVISAWNFSDEIQNKLKRIRPNKKDIFLNYFPIFSISRNSA